MTERQAEQIRRRMEETRAQTLALFDLAREEDLHESPGFGFRPVIWHLAHIGVFEAYWLLQKLKNEPAPDARYERIFDPISTPREESRDLPSRREMESYLERVRGRVLSHLEREGFDDGDALRRGGYVYSLVLEHEQQHQETLAYLLHLLGPEKKTRQSALSFPAAGAVEPGMVLIPAGEFVMGAGAGDFVYDNEGPAHAVHVAAFRLDKLLVTNEEYARFVSEGGYRRREFWGEEGWQWRERENWEAPLYWKRQEGGGWRVRTMFGEEEEAAGGRQPVTGVSWYEAEAYARFAGKRLPTEAEWEKAAGWDAGTGRKRRFSWGDEEPSPALCNSDFSYWGTTPVGSFPEGATPEGLLDMTGNVWEWTGSAFAGYPDFAAFPYPEYSEVWFDGDHRVLKGGSWATRRSVLRITFRNFFRRHFRIAFAGIRCAADAS